MQPQDPNQQPQPATPQQNPEPHVDDTVNGKAIYNPLESMQPGERVICEIKRHPIGILGIYISLIAVVALIAVIGYGFGPQIFTNYDSKTVYGYVTMATLIVAALCALFGYVAHVVYWGNRWIVTDDSVTQVIQNSLFSKQSSQLSMANLEDITADKNGVIQQMFNFGMLKCETAGAQKSKFYFLYCPNPEYYAKAILSAREVFEQRHYRNEASQVNPTVNQNYQQPQYQAAPAASYQQPQPEPQNQAAEYQPPAPQYYPPQSQPNEPAGQYESPEPSEQPPQYPPQPQ